jgi:alpha(1,3/1,4) fucosyltransferase
MNLGFWNFYRAYNSNRMFQESTSELGDDLAYPGVYMARRLRELGHQVNTLDMGSLTSFDAAIFYDHPTFLNQYYRQLCKVTGKKLYLFLLENPANRPDNYWRRNHRPFEKVFTWDSRLVNREEHEGREGQTRVAEKNHSRPSRFVPEYVKMWLPIRIPESFTINRAEKTKYCVTIFSQKYSGHSAELYSERMRAVRWFEREHPSEFDLFGLNWDRFYFSGKLSRLNLFLQKFYSTFPGAPRVHRFPSYRGPVKRKNTVMREYKFAIAYENAAFPGYVSEKIFDAFFAGCVPIYIGAPDVTDDIPPETFIDKRNFPDYPSLYRYLKGMSAKEYNERLDAIENFVRGERIKLFGPENFTHLILKHIVEPHLRAAPAGG